MSIVWFSTIAVLKGQQCATINNPRCGATKQLALGVNGAFSNARVFVPVFVSFRPGILESTSNTVQYFNPAVVTHFHTVGRVRYWLRGCGRLTTDTDRSPRAGKLFTFKTDKIFAEEIVHPRHHRDPVEPKSRPFNRLP